jgi:hypothetical protein
MEITNKLHHKFQHITLCSTTKQLLKFKHTTLTMYATAPATAILTLKHMSTTCEIQAKQEMLPDDKHTINNRYYTCNTTKNDGIADVQERAANAKNVNWIDYKITETTDYTYRHPKAYISPTAITLTCALCWCRQRRRTGTDVGWSHRGARRLSR